MIAATSDAPLRPGTGRFVVPAALAVVLVLALGIRLHYALDCAAVPAGSDMEYYNVIAERGGVPAEAPPGYPLFLRLLYAVWGPRNYTAVYVAQAVLGTATVLLVFFVTRAVAGARAALFASGIAAVYPSFIAYALTTMTETISILIVLLLFGALTLPRGERTRSLLAAAAVATGYLFKPALLFFAPGALFSVKRRLVFLAALAALLAPPLAYDLLSGNTALRGARGLYRTYNPATQGTDARMEDTELGRTDLPAGRYIGGAIDFLRRNKMKTVDIIYTKAAIAISRGSDRLVLEPVVGRRDGVWMLLVYGYVPIAMLGLFGIARYFDANTRRVALPVLGYLVLVVLLSIFKPRYRLLAEPAAIMFAGMTLASIRIPRPNLRRLARLVAPPEPEPAAPGCEGPEEGAAGPRGIRARLRADWDIACLLFLVALALRIYFAVAADEPIHTHEAEAMRGIVESGALSSDVAPVYPLALRAARIVFGADYRPIFVIQAILGAVSVLLIFSFVSAVSGRKAAVAAGAVAALLPSMLLMHLRISPSTLALLCVAGLMTVAASSLASSAKAALSGFLAGVGVLVAPYFAFVVPGALFVQKRWRLFLLALAGTLVPYVVCNVAQQRALEPVYAPAAYAIRASDIFTGDRPWDAVKRIYENAALAISKRWGIEHGAEDDTSKKISTFIAGYSFVAVLWLGFIGIARCPLRRHAAVFLPPLLYAALVIVLSDFQMKHRAIYLPAVIAFAAMFATGSCKRRPE